jgi:hypothetical protein
MDVGLIPSADNVEDLRHKDGSTEDIMKVVIEASNKKPKKGFCEFAQQFDRSYNGLRDLWSFVKYKIPYRVDPDGRQDILLPSALYERGYGDCKSKTVFIVHVLKCLNIPYIVRFTAYTKGANVSHVYPIAYLNGKYVIIDSVYDFFDREKSFKEKIDYNMTKISMISGFREPDIDADVKRRLSEIKDKQSIVTQQEYINMSKSIGETRSFLLRRQLQLLRAFNSDNPKKVTEFTKAINNLDRAITKGVLGYKVATVSGSSDIVSAVNQFINTKLKDNRPTFSYTNTANFKSRISGVPADYNSKFPFDTKKMNFGDLMVTVNGKQMYKLGANSRYAVEARSFLSDAIAKYVKENAGLPLLDANGNPVTRTIQILNRTVTVPVQKILLSYLRENGLPVSSNIAIPANQRPAWFMSLQNLASNSGGNYSDAGFRNWFNGLLFDKDSKQFAEGLIANNQTKLLTTEFGNFSPSNKFETFYSATFGNEDIKAEFEKYIEEQSGIYQEYLQTTVFNETGKVGAGVIYDYASGIPNLRSLNDLPTSVVTKKAVQSNWMDGASYYTGADSTIIRDMGRNTSLFALGENPEDTLSKLYASSKPNIGLDPVTIGLIITGIVSLLTTVIETMGKSKREADEIADSPEKAMQFQPPLGPNLMPDEGDWTSGSNGGTGGGTGGNNGSGTGVSTNLLLGLGLAGAGAYYLYSKNKKR